MKYLIFACDICGKKSEPEKALNVGNPEGWLYGFIFGIVSTPQFPEGGKEQIVCPDCQIDLREAIDAVIESRKAGKEIK